jgi:F-type H+-transporting ATPase subunit alpha
MSLSKQVSILYAVNNGYMDDVPVEKVSAFELDFYRFMETSHPEIFKRIETEKELKEELENLLKSAITEFKQTVSY